VVDIDFMPYQKGLQNISNTHTIQHSQRVHEWKCQMMLVNEYKS
jgi:hypothetical protein